MSAQFGLLNVLDLPFSSICKENTVYSVSLLREKERASQKYSLKLDWLMNPRLTHCLCHLRADECR